jgi:hypothetical protein
MDLGVSLTLRSPENTESGFANPTPVNWGGQRVGRKIGSQFPQHEKRPLLEKSHAKTFLRLDLRRGHRLGPD